MREEAHCCLRAACTECVDDPTQSSCGAPPGQYPNLVWALNETSGALTSAEFPVSWGLTLLSNATLQVLPLDGIYQSNQTWAWNASSGLLSVPSSGLCLSTQPQVVYAQIFVVASPVSMASPPMMRLVDTVLVLMSMGRGPYQRVRPRLRQGRFLACHSTLSFLIASGLTCLVPLLTLRLTV